VRFIKTAFFTIFAMAALLAAPARAQLGPGLTPPPVFESVDANGVELQYGKVVQVLASISIGPPSAGGLRFDWSTDSSRQAAVWGYVTFGQNSIDPSKDNASVTIGGSTETFTSPHGAYSFTQDQGRPSALAYNSATSTYTYTGPDGSVAVFNGNVSIGPQLTATRINSLTYPAGQRLDYYYGTDSGYTNVHAVTSSLGYQLRLTWSAGFVTSAVLFNMNSEACDPAAPTCTLTGSWPALTWDAANSRVVDNTGKWVGYTVSAGQTVISYPSGRTLTYTSDGNGGSYADGKGTWTYQRPFPYGTTTIVFNPEYPSNPRVVHWSLTSGLVEYESVSSAPPTVNYSYDSKNRLTGLKTTDNTITTEAKYHYDAQGNLDELRQISTTPGTPADIVQIAHYPDPATSGCNAKTCNLPDYVIDAKGNRTDYSYDPNNGEVATVTLPAPTAGAVRPQVRYTYTQMSALFKNGSGTIVSGSPAWMLATSSECQTQSACAGTADEVKITIAYDVNQGLRPNSITEGNGTGSLAATSVFTWTGTGDVKTVDGPLPTNSDTTRNYYDAMRRPLGSIGPDPDGGGALHRRAVKVSYDNDGRPVTKDIGTATGQGDNDLTNMTSLQQQVTTYDAQARVAMIKATAGGTTYSLLQRSYSAAGAPDCLALRMNPAIFGSPSADPCTVGTEGSYGRDRIVKYAHDARLRTTSVTTAYGTGDAAVDVTNTFDGLGRLSTVKDGENNLTTYEYDGMSRLVKTRYPVSAKGANSSSTTDYEQLTYDPNSNVTSQRLRDGSSMNFVYDNLDRLTVKAPPIPNQRSPLAMTISDS